MKRLLVMSDLHCGHVAGLTPPRWQLESTVGRKREKFSESQREAWEFYFREVQRYKPYDAVVVNGDAIDGRGERSGGTELITSDRSEQCDMARHCIRTALTKDRTKLVMTYGTAYHTGQEEDWEGIIARDLNAAKIGAHEWLDVDGYVFDFKHHVGSSSVPYGRHTAVAKEDTWNIIFHEKGKQPRSDVIVRSHVHYYKYAGDEERQYLTTPALQTMGSKFGSRRCSGDVTFGFVVFEVDRDGFTHYPVWARLKSEVSEAIKV